VKWTSRYRPSNVRTAIYREILANPNVTLDELQQALHAAEMKLSLAATGTVASDFRRILKFLTQEGLINSRRLRARQRRVALLLPLKRSTGWE
jgi:hypothetical protein